jgi:hypothetical protein
VANLGAPGFPRVLFYRNPFHIVTFSLQSQSDEVVVDYDEVFTNLAVTGALVKDKQYHDLNDDHSIGRQTQKDSWPILPCA